ncbi:MAG TPA: glutamate-cysteine ligase family protein [Longimicrobium sp.]|jgi:glutamate--cysteine ligase
MTLPLHDLAAGLAETAFCLGTRTPGPPRVGAEVELIPVMADSRRRAPIVAEEGPSTLPLLRRFGAERCWREEATPYGAPRWMLPDGGCVSYEPGGQIELSAAPARSASALLRSLRAVVPALRAAARDEGIELLSLGIDPVNGLEDTPPQLPGARYARLTRFLEAIGTGGVRMMRQTAAFQPSLDWGPDPLARWRFLNAAAPYLTAIFANSPAYGGRDTGWRSFRARVWRELDGGRTGTFPCADPVSEYLRFALDAPAILLGGEGGPWLPFRAWNERGAATAEDWGAHLSTLFPEVRPKGFVEVRCIDAMEPEWYAAPVLLLTGLCDHAPTFRAALDLLGTPDPSLLEPAARLGLADPRIGPVARDLFELGLAGAAALGPSWAAPEDMEDARQFFARVTRREHPSILTPQ